MQVEEGVGGEGAGGEGVGVEGTDHKGCYMWSNVKRLGETPPK